MKTIETKPTLVIGGTGKTGRRVAERLTKRGMPVRTGSRSSQPAFDWNEPTMWPAAVEGVGAAYITYYPDLAVPGTSAVIRAFTELAVKSGVEKLVLLSGRGEPEAQACEEVVRHSGAAFTLLRASWFSQNFSEDFLLDAVIAGEVALPASNLGDPFVDVDDIADVAVAALTDDRHAGQLYEVTGPRVWTFAEATAEIARLTNRPIHYVPVTADEYKAGLEAMQLPPEAVTLILYLFTEVLGNNAYVADGVQRALGRAPRDFSEYARDAAATGVWAAPAAAGGRS